MINKKRLGGNENEGERRFLAKEGRRGPAFQYLLASHNICYKTHKA